MRPAIYTRQRDAARYAADLARAFPESIGLSFEAVPHDGGYGVKATDRANRSYLMTARREHVGSANFVELPPC